MSVIETLIDDPKYVQIKTLANLKRGDVLLHKNPSGYLVVVNPGSETSPTITKNLNVTELPTGQRGKKKILVNGLWNYTLDTKILPEEEVALIGNIDNLAPFLIQALASVPA